MDSACKSCQEMYEEILSQDQTEHLQKELQVCLKSERETFYRDPARGGCDDFHESPSPFLTN